MQASNKALGQEKQRMDVLLARQYNLISVMAQQGVVGSMGGRTGSSSLEEKTLGRLHAAAQLLVAESCRCDRRKRVTYFVSVCRDLLACLRGIGLSTG